MPAPPEEPRRSLTLEGLAAFEASKRRQRHPAALHAAIRCEQAQAEASGKPYCEAEAAGQMALEFEAPA